MVSVIFTLFLIISVQAEKKFVTKIDDAQQTNQDYSIVVKSPPKYHLTGPKSGEPLTCDDFKAFFSKFGDVAAVSIVKRNGNLLRAIGDREVYREKLRRFYMHQEVMGPPVYKFPILKSLGQALELDSYLDDTIINAKLMKLDAEILRYTLYILDVQKMEI